MTDDERLAEINDLVARAATVRNDIETGNVRAEDEHDWALHAEYLDEEAALAKGEWPYPATPPIESVAAVQATRAEWYRTVTEIHDDNDMDAR